MVPAPNIIWISIDSVRQDRTTLGGHFRDTTPRLSDIASEDHSVAFSNCISHGLSTRTSIASTFTARHPGNHGVSTLANSKLSDSIPTVAELLRDIGYYTVGISTNAHVSNATGLDRGFEEFVWISPQNLRDIGLRTLFKFAINIRRHSIGFDREPSAHSPEFLVNDIAKRHLRVARGKEPFFMFAHYNGPHSPYYPPLPWLDRYLDGLDVTPGEARWLAKQAHYRKQPNKESEFDIEIGEWDQTKQETLRALYDAELLYTDEMVGRLYEFVESLDIGPTVIVITSDHGELLGERGRFAHGDYPLEGLINVPLVITGLDGLPESDALIQHADLTHTLSNLAGAPIPDSDGIDIRSENRSFAVTQAFEPSILSIRSSSFKYEDGLDGERLYELPHEEDNVSEQYPSVFEEYRQIAAGINRSPGESATLSEGAAQQLADLGYVLK